MAGRQAIPPSILRERAAARLQRGFRLLLARRAVAQVRRLLVDEPVLWRLHAVVARTESNEDALRLW